MQSFQLYAGEADMAKTARDNAKTAEEGLAASKQWSAYKTAEIMARLALRMQQIAASDRQGAAQRASQEAQPRSIYRYYRPQVTGATELEQRANDAEGYVKCLNEAAEKFGRKGDRLAAAARGNPGYNPDNPGHNPGPQPQRVPIRPVRPQPVQQPQEDKRE
jgi:hypothetical protein